MSRSNNSEPSHQSNEPVNEWLFVSDVDDTLLGDEEALGELKAALLPERRRIGLALNSSRPCASLHRSLREHRSLPRPDFLIGALGTEIEYADGNPVEVYSRRSGDHWDRNLIEDLVPSGSTQAHAAEFQTAFKVSYDISDTSVADQVRDRLADAGIAATVIVTHGVAMDIIPADAGKGAAIVFLRNLLRVEMGRVVVAGDSANDIDMFADEHRGIVVANADEELKNLAGPHIYHAQRPYAAGVLDGLRHWNVLH